MRGRPCFLWDVPIVGAIAGLKLLIHALTLEPYGWFRDELYYVACSEHLALGYVDHPPLSIAVLKAWRALFGDSLAAMRLVPAIAGAAVVYLAGSIALALGGGRAAAAVAAVAVLAAPMYLGVDHLYSMNALGGLFWTLGAWLTVRAVSAPGPARWASLGVVLGLGLLNKWSVLWFGAGLLAGLVLTQARASLATRGPYIAGVIALSLFAPNLVWQAQHGFPTLEFMHNVLTLKYVRGSIGSLLGQQVEMMSPATLPLTLAGLLAPFAARSAPAGRVLAWIFLVTFGIVAASGGKAEYLAPAYPMLFAVGAVAWERWLATFAPRRIGPVAVATSLAMLALGAVGAPFALPVLSEPGFVAYAQRLGVTPESAEKSRSRPEAPVLGDLARREALRMSSRRTVVSAQPP